MFVLFFYLAIFNLFTYLFNPLWNEKFPQTAVYNIFVLSSFQQFLVSIFLREA